MARIEPQSLPPYGNGTLPAGIRSRVIDNSNGLAMHVLEAGEGMAPLVLLLHGFPELAYSWRKVMLPLAAAGYHVVAPDQRGYGRTTGWNDDYDGDLIDFRLLNLVRDTLGLVAALGHTSVAAVVGHDFGAPVAANSALIRPDVFHALTIMSSPYAGPPALAPANPYEDARNSPSRGLVFDELSKLDRPRKHYQRYYQTRPANGDMWRAPQGVHDFLRGYYHHKSADWMANKPHSLGGFTADELAKMPTYYIMDFADDMAATVAKEMPSRDAIAANCWLTEGELAVYAGEYARLGFQGGLNWYRCTDWPRQQTEMQIFSGRTIDVPATFIAGKSDWGVYQFPGAFQRMQTKAVCTDWRGAHLIDGAGHWVQQEQPEQVTRLLIDFIKGTAR